MSNVSVEKLKLDVLATAISNKSGVPVTMTLAEMVDAVDNIQIGGDQHGTIWQDSQGNVHLDDESGIALQSKTAIPTELPQIIEADEGYYALDKVTVGVIPSSYVGSGITRRSSSDLTVSGATVTAPAGYYTVQASKSVATGTAGTPTATKGTVSNHAITVTPSVTNTTGYISGGTKTGTGVSVSASELVSGTKTITENGTGIDVTNYASVDVNVSGGASNLVQGEFTTSATGGVTQLVSIPYNGNGYPIAVTIEPAGGWYSNESTAFYNLIQRYVTINYCAIKMDMNTAPTYIMNGGTSNQNSATVMYTYKNSTSNALISAVKSSSLTFYNGDETAYENDYQVILKNSTTMYIFVASSSYGFAPATKYTYQIVYSE